MGFDEGGGPRGDRPGMHRIVRRPPAWAECRRSGGVEAVGGNGLGITEVPLAEDAGRITRGLQQFRDRHLFLRQRMKKFRGEQPATPVARDVIRDLHAGRMPAGHQGRAGGRTDGAGRIAPREEHPIRCQPVDRGRAVERAARAAEVMGPEVVGKKYEQVRLPRCRDSGGHGAYVQNPARCGHHEQQNQPATGSLAHAHCVIHDHLS